MDAVKFITGMRRICQNNNCKDCVLSPFCCKILHERTEVDAEEAVKIVEEWVEAHAVKTRQSELLKMYPKITMDENGVVGMCPSNFDASACKKSKGCNDCRREFWLQEVE